MGANPCINKALSTALNLARASLISSPVICPLMYILGVSIKLRADFTVESKSL